MQTKDDADDPALSSPDPPATVPAFVTPADDTYYHETSHVFKCMQRDLQFQTDIATVGHQDTIDTEFVRLRIAPSIHIHSK